MKKKIDSLKKRQERILGVIDILSKIYPNIKIQLDFSNPFELLIATMLSAQCTDARVNQVTKKLFVKYKSPKDYIDVSQEELEKDIFSTGYYKSKAERIRKACYTLYTQYDSKVPETMEELIQLDGVGRKTANVVLSHCFNIPGIVVDTHVTRISNLLGLVNTNDAVKIELELEKIIPKEYWVIFTHYFINHGRNTCIARRPQCKTCLIEYLCPNSKLKIL